MHDQNLEDSTFQLVIDQLEELVVTLVEEIRERPAVALAIGAGLVGAIVGSLLAARVARGRASAPVRGARRARRIGDAADLAKVGVRLLQNPIVRGLMMTALERQLKRRMPR